MISPPDKTIIIVVTFLVVIGIMAIFSAGAPKCIMQDQNPASFALKQMAWLIIGIFGMKFFMNYDYKRLSSWAVPFAWFVIIMLALVDFTPLGVVVNGAKRWIMLGPIQFQPSEMTKPAAILLLANAFYRDSALFVERKIMRYFVPILLMVFLVFKQPNLSMVILLAIVSVIMYLNAGGSMKMFFSMVGTALCGLVFFIKPYQLGRLKIWLHPEIDPYGAGYNIIQSLIAFAAGGFWGVGYGSSKQKLAWLPEGHTDFIFAVIGEELGFIGCLMIIGLFFTFIQRGLIVSSRCTNMFGKLLASGITFSIGVQAFINMGVSSSFIPTTGVPLPFISYGGTSLLVSMCMVGVLLNISKKRIRKIRVMSKSDEKKYTYFVSGGGTGGHIYPAVAVLDELLLKDDTNKVYFVGNKKNLEFELLKDRNDVEFLSVDVKGMPRKFSFKFITWLCKLEISLWKALFYILKYKPDAIFTTGGYVSAPIAFAAILLKKPFMIHDCDAQPGLVSKFVAPCADIVSVAFDKSKEFLDSKKIITNGNPIRKSFSNYSKETARSILKLDNKLTVLAMGGSQGAKTINNVSVQIAQKLTEELNIQFIVQTGKKNYEAVIKQFEEYFPHFRENTNLIIKPYFDEMAIPLKAADIVISRAGSLSLSEIEECALASVLVPYPYAASDHQRKNAKEMCNKGASLYIEDADCTKDNLLEKLMYIVNTQNKLLEMGQAAKDMSKQNATENIVNELKSLIKND